MPQVSYPAFLEPADVAGGGAYGVVFPDLPGCVSWGADLDAALANAREALTLHLQGLADDAEAAPPPSHPRDLYLDWQPAHRPVGACWAAITADLPQAPVRINVSIDEALLRRIDAAAERAGQTRSGFLAEAARQALADAASLTEQARARQRDRVRAALIDNGQL